MEDLPDAMSGKTTPKVKGSGSCSALIKLLPGNKDMYVSHVTWSTYQSMLRVLKKYDFGFHTSSGEVFQKQSWQYKICKKSVCAVGE